MRWIAPTEKDEANHPLEKRLWAAADQFRANSGLKAGEYSGPVLGLTHPGPRLSTEEREEVKKVARQLLERLNALLVLGWRQKIQSRAKIHLAIEDTLEGLPRAYTKDLFAKKSGVLFERVYEAYAGDGRSVFDTAA
jgi:hypothetical protein